MNRARRDDGDVDAGSREHYEDALLYDYEYRRRRKDVNFYRDLARRLAPAPGPILELACGSGRVTIPLARAGYRVIGMDLSAPMLERAVERLSRKGRATRERISWVRADMRRFCLGKQFPLIVMGFNAFEHLYTRTDVEACLYSVKQHLAPGGYFAFDVHHPDLRWLCRDPDKRWARTRFTHPRSGARFTYTTNHVYDGVSQIAIIRLYYQPLSDDGEPDGDEHVVTLSQRKFFPAELEALLHANGFDVHARYGDFAGAPLSDDADSQVLVCQKRAPDAHTDEPGARVVARLGIKRDGESMYFVKRGALWSMPYGKRENACKVADLGLVDIDPDRHVYHLDHRGHVVRVRRPRLPRKR